MIRLTRTILIALVTSIAFVTFISEAAAQPTVQGEKKEGSTIRGIVTYADTGRPVRHAGVALIRNDTGVWQGNAVTDGHGRFTFENMPAARYLLIVDAPGILKPQSYARNGGSVSAQIRVTETRDLFREIVVNGTDAVDVTLQAVRGGVITGRVVTDDDQPAADADVKLLVREDGKWVPVLFTWRDDPKLKTDPNGVYRIAGLYAGEYLVRVSEPQIGYDGMPYDDEAYSDGELMVTYYPAANGLKDAQAVTVVEGSESTGVDIRMIERTGRTISGTLTVGADDDPAAYADLVIERAEEVGFGSKVRDSTTRADHEGKWEMRGVPAGDYVIRLRGGTVRVGSGESAGHIYIATKEIRVTVDHDDVVVNIRLSPGAAVIGRVKFEGPPLERLHELSPGLFPAGDKPDRPPNDMGLRTTLNYRSGYVRDDSKFEINGLAAGKYWFLMSGFRSDQHYVKSVTRNGADISQKPIKLEAGKVLGDVLITLASDLATIEGQLQLGDVAPKTSVEDVLVMLAPANDATRRFSTGLLTVHPDAKGKFTFTCGPGEYFVSALTRKQREKLKKPMTEDDFKQDKQKSQRVKVKAGEQLKGVTLSLGVN
jgi:hypothetical protein